MNAASNNIVQFPPDRIRPGAPVINAETITEKVDDFKKLHIQEAIETIVPILFNQISALGFEPEDSDEDDEEFYKDGALVVEAIRSFMSRIHLIHHPLQIISKNMFESDGEQLVVSSKIKIVITPTDEKESD